MLPPSLQCGFLSLDPKSHQVCFSLRSIGMELSITAARVVKARLPVAIATKKIAINSMTNLYRNLLSDALGYMFAAFKHYVVQVSPLPVLSNA